MGACWIWHTKRSSCMLVPFVHDKWCTSWLFCGRHVASLKDLVCIYLEQNSHVAFSSACYHASVCLYLCTCTYTKHKHRKKTFSPVLERHLMNAPLRFTWALRQGTWLSLRDLSVWFKPIIFSNCFQSLFMVSAFSMIRKLSRLTIYNLFTAFLHERKNYRTENKWFVKWIKKKKKNLESDPLTLPEKLFHNRPLGLTSSMIQMFQYKKH